MSNRIYSSRLDFRPGWVVKDQRYAVPGAPAEMFNTQLDLLSEGALRQTWGTAPFAFWGTVGAGGQLKADSAPNAGRRPGICAIANTKDGDDGEADVIIVADQQKNGSNTDTVFYWVTDPSTYTSPINMIWGNNITASCQDGQSLTFHYADVAFVMGRERTDYPMTVSMSSTYGTLSGYGTWAFTWAAPSPGTPTTYTVDLVLTHTETAETASLALSVGVGTASSYKVSEKYYAVAIGNPFPDQTVLCNSTQTFSLYDPAVSPLRQTGVWAATVGTTVGGGAFLIPWANETVTYPIYQMSSNYSKAYWETTGAQFNLGFTDGYGGSFLGTGTIRHFLPLQPTRAQEHSSTYLGQGTAMRPINTVSSVTQPRTGPLGIWKSATMNGRAYWFNGYSGTSFWHDADDPTTTGTIGLTRPTNSVTLSTDTRTGSSEKGQWPKRRVRYWISETDGDGLESGLSVDYVEIDNKDFTDDLVVLSNIPSASTTLSKINIYRSFTKDASPYFLTSGAKGASTWSYRDHIPDDELGDPPWTHGDLPPYDAFCPVVYYDRLWCLGTRPGVATAVRTTLFWSDINEPESFWWDGNWANVYGDDGDEVTALVRDRTGLLIFKNNHLYLMSGRTPDEISFNEITVEDSDTGVGCPHINAVVATDFGVFFYWNRGIYRYLQGQVVKVSGPISPILEGRQDAFTVATDSVWPYYGRPYGWSVTMDYDNVSQVVYFGCRGEFPTQLFDPTDVTETSTNELTALLDVKNARWIGMYTYHLGLIRRANVKLHENWKGGGETWVSNMLIGAPMSDVNIADLGYGVHHPIAFVPGMAGMGNMPINSKAKFRPIIGNLGPFSSKRFLYVDYLIDEQGIDYTSTDASVRSILYLDGATTGTASTLTVGGGAVYSEQLRHVLGHVGSEVEVEVVFDPNKTGDLIRLFEYSVGWQNLGRERAERPGSAPSSPPGGPGWTSPPVSIGGGGGRK